MRILLGAFAAATVLAAAAPASALALVSYSYDTSTTAIQGFDDSLGTLTHVLFRVGGPQQVSLFVSPNTPGEEFDFTRSLTIDVDYTIGALSGHMSESFEGPPIHIPGTGLGITTGCSCAAQALFTDAPTLALFSNPGLLASAITFNWTDVYTLVPDIGAVEVRSASSLNRVYVDYIYDETAVVPEPGAWALMILGFGAVGAALRRRAAALA
jgi:hypothetical protein